MSAITREQIETVRAMERWLHDRISFLHSESVELGFTSTEERRAHQASIESLTAKADALAALLRVVEQVGKLPIMHVWKGRTDDEYARREMHCDWCQAVWCAENEDHPANGCLELDRRALAAHGGEETKA